MGKPAFKMNGARFTDSGEYGTSAYGTAVYGGGSWPAVEVVVHLGSDDLRRDLRQTKARVVLERYGAVVASRTWKQVRRWSVNINVAPLDHIEALMEFFTAGEFELFTDSDGGASYAVRWVDDEFAPSYVKPGHYGLTFTIEEV